MSLYFDSTVDKLYGAFQTLFGIAVTKKPINLVKLREPESTG